GLEYRPSFREVAGEDFVIRDQSLAQRAMNIRRDTLIPTFKNLRFQMLQ
ncbi:564_t:CDS:2, partial [Entrophospora sp. SA101]